MRIAITLVLFAAIVGAAAAQNDRPSLYAGKPATKREIDERQSLHQYVDGLLFLRAERFADALKAFEEAARLDPDAPALVKAQAPILIGLGRYADALAACKKVVALDSADYGAWYAQAKILKTLVKYDEATTALESAMKSERLKDHPEAAAQLHAELGELYEHAKKFGPAADEYTKAAAIFEHPDQIVAKGHVPRELVLARASETYEKIGLLYRKAKQYDDAIAALRKAQDRSPERAGRLNYLLAQVCEEHGDLKQALRFVDAYLDTRPLSTEPHELKIGLLRRLKQADDIVPWLEEAASRDRFNNPLQLVLARECATAKQSKKAEAIYLKLAEDSPSADLYRGLFNLYKDDGSMLRVLAMVDKVMDKAAREDGPAPLGTVQHARAMVAALRADGPLAQSLVDAAFSKVDSKSELKFDTIYFLAHLADRQRQYDKAERFYRQCLDDKNIPLTSEAPLYAGLLRTLSAARKHEAIVKVCNEGLVKAKGTNALLFYQELARAQAGLKKYDDALESIDRALKTANADESFVMHRLRIGILSMAHRYSDAETECLTLLKKHERPAEVVTLRYILSGIYSTSKQPAKAEEQLQLILKIDPDNPSANNDLGYQWADQGKNLAAAEQMIRKALDVERTLRRRNPNLTPDEDKDNAAFVDSLGWVLFRRGQVEEAKKELERALALDDTNDPVIHDHLGDVYQQLKLHPEASRAWQRALGLYEQGARGKDEERVKDLRRKIDQIKQQLGGR